MHCHFDWWFCCCALHFARHLNKALATTDALSTRQCRRRCRTESRQGQSTTTSDVNGPIEYHTVCMTTELELRARWITLVICTMCGRVIGFETGGGVSTLFWSARNPCNPRRGKPQTQPPSANSRSRVNLAVSSVWWLYVHCWQFDVISCLLPCRC